MPCKYCEKISLVGVTCTHCGDKVKLSTLKDAECEHDFGSLYDDARPCTNICHKCKIDFSERNKPAPAVKEEWHDLSDKQKIWHLLGRVEALEGKPRPAENKRRLADRFIKADTEWHSVKGREMKQPLTQIYANSLAEEAKAEFVRVIESMESHERSGFFGTFISKESLLRKASEL